MSKCTVCARVLRRGLKTYTYREDNTGNHTIGGTPFLGKRKCLHSLLACSICYEAARKQVWFHSSQNFAEVDLVFFDALGLVLGRFASSDWLRVVFHAFFHFLRYPWFLIYLDAKSQEKRGCSLQKVSQRVQVRFSCWFGVSYQFGTIFPLGSQRLSEMFVQFR